LVPGKGLTSRLILRHGNHKGEEMILVGENLNIISKTIGPALRERNPEPIQELARAEAEAGVDYIDLNIGPARKAGDELMQWVVETVQGVTDKPLSLDTTNPVAMEAGLKVCKSRALINSISLARMDEEIPLVGKYDAEMIGLLWGREGMPRDAAERGMIAVELMYKANEMGIPNESIWFDPIATPVVNIEANQSKPCLEFMSMLQDIAPGCKSIVGLSNVSNGAPTHLRPYLNRTYLMMLMKYGLYSAIVDAFDSELITIARGERPEIVNLVYRMMDGEKPAISSLSEEEVKYAKTVRVLTGETLYSHSWLEL
jgi:5-methyltetrahydrofolate corrinoid/iron sulfur protein methyltransferase